MTRDGALVRAVSLGLSPADRDDDIGNERPVADATTVSLAVSHRVQGLLAAALEHKVVIADAATTTAVLEAHLAALRTCLVAEETAVLAFDALHGAGVECRVLKGIAIAELDHDDPSHRVFGDADMLVARADYGGALDALFCAGFIRDEPPVRAWWERRFGKAIVLRAPNGGELDLHLALTGGYFGAALDGEAVMRRPGEAIMLAGRVMSALDREDRLVQACLHSVLGGGSGLRAQRDIAQLLIVREADWRLTIERADVADAVLARAIRHAWTALELTVEHPALKWAISHRATEQQEKALASYDAAVSSTWGPEGRGVLAALGSFDRLRFVAGLAFPSRASLRARDRTRWQHVRRGSANMQVRS